MAARAGRARRRGAYKRGGRAAPRLRARCGGALRGGRQGAPQGFPPCVQTARSAPSLSLPSPPFSDESLQPREVRAEKQPLGAQPGHLPQQNPGGRPHELAVQHERLLLQAEGAGAQHPAEQEGQQDGNPPARHRLHPGPADRLGLAPQHRQPAPPAAGTEPVLQDPADHPQHRHQHPLPTGSRVPLRTHVK